MTTRRVGQLVPVFVLVLLLLPRLSPAQTSTPPNSNAPTPGMTASAGIDFVNQYMFRGLRQNSTGIAIWPWADLGIEAYSGHGRIESIDINIGIWNSLNTGDTGLDGPGGDLWFEADFYATLDFGFGGGVSAAATYTAYTSPNDTFTTVKEFMIKVTVDDSSYLGSKAVKPYAIVARETNTAPGLAQADLGDQPGTYLELGIAPGYAGSKATMTVPVKVGLSLDDYYELAGVDHPFGFFSVAGIVTIPLGPTTRFGAWNVRAGVAFQTLGKTTTFVNGGDDSQVIGSIGLGFSY